MRLSEIRHQDRALSIIRRSLSSGRTHHAYLFEGPEGVGKETTARALVARLLCPATEPAVNEPTAVLFGAAAEDAADETDACGRCDSCRLLAAGNHPDFHLIHRGLHKLHPNRTIRNSIGLFLAVEVIRHFLIEPGTNAPALGRRRVFLIRDAERMNEQAQNALLKTLEEPPGQACLILVTSSASRLLPTIRSRCQRVMFDLLPPAFVEEQLVAQTDLAAEAAQTLAGLAQGRLGIALRWERVDLLTTLEEVNECLARGLERDPPAFGAAVTEMANNLALRGREAGADEDATEDLEPDEDAARTKAAGKTVPTDELRAALKLVLMLVAAVYRDALILQAGQAEGLRHLPQALDAPRSLARAHSLDELEACIQAVVVAEQMLDRNVAPQLTCERLAIALAGDVPVG